MKIAIDRPRCEGYGCCEEAAPAIFKLDDEGELQILKSEISDREKVDAEAAVRACPVAALYVIDD